MYDYIYDAQLGMSVLLLIW